MKVGILGLFCISILLASCEKVLVNEPKVDSNPQQMVTQFAKVPATGSTYVYKLSDEDVNCYFVVYISSVALSCVRVDRKENQ